MRVLQHEYGAQAAARPVARPTRKLTPKIESTGPIGVTLVSPRYMHLAEEAVSRFRKWTGLDAVILWSEVEPAFAAKLNLDLLVAPRPIVFFDVDLWLLRPVDFRPLAESDRWCAVPDPCAWNMEGFPGVDTAREGWDPDTYFNSGLFACDLSRPEIRQVFVDARAQLDRVHAGAVTRPVDHTDQYYLNWGVQRRPGLLKPLPLEMNFYHVSIAHSGVRYVPVPLTGLHAAGLPVERKLEALREQAKVLGPAVVGRGS
jgi:hypothetical protein